MSWYGKLIGVVLGALLAKHPLGMLVGLLVGHYLDLQLESAALGAQRTVPEAFFRATFQTMGHIAKADGRVSEEEIRAARAVMAQFRLSEAEVHRAIELFTEGKASDFPLQATLSQLHQLLGQRHDLRRMFVQIQLQAALLGEGVQPHVRALLKRICQIFDISEFELAQMEALLRMQRGGGWDGSTQHASQSSRLRDAYSVLGVTAQSSDAEVTKAYRRLMNQNHPDKLAAKGLPDGMKVMAEEKTRQIRAAYELIKEARGMK